jgi:hypothetical protein
LIVMRMLFEEVSLRGKSRGEERAKRDC